MPPFSSLLTRISGSASDAWGVCDHASRLMLEGHDIIHLGVGDPDLDVAPAVRRAVAASLAAGRTHYAPLAGEPALRATIAGHATRLYGVEVGPDEVAVCSGAQGALFAVFQLLAGAGDEVIVPSPFYATYPAAVTAGGAKMVTVTLDAHGGFGLDVAAIAAAITPRTKAILINSPSNPTGVVIPQGQMDALVDLAAERDIWLVSDEVYWSLCYDVPHASPMRHPDARQKVVVVNSVSKSHAMTGFRIGWAIGPAALIDAMTTLAQSLYFGINQFAQDAAAVALLDSATPLTIREVFRERRDALISALSQVDGLRFTAPQGGMFLLADVSATGRGGEAYATGLLEEEGVAVVPGFGFGAEVDHMIRIGFLCEPGRLAEAALRIQRYTDRLVR